MQYPVSYTKQSWRGPVSLLVLSFIPVLAGASRLLDISTAGHLTTANARFMASPVPVSLHIVSVTLFCVLGAFQFWPRFLSKTSQWHKIAGRIMVPCGLIAALTAVWMTLFYPVAENDGPLLYWERLVFGAGMLACLLLGMRAIYRRDFIQHGKWMMRGYAIGLGAGTQAITQLPLILMFGPPSELNRGLLMGGAWVLNLLVAEWTLREPPSHARHVPLVT
jgi:uncharacterized membrane protein